MIDPSSSVPTKASTMKRKERVRRNTVDHIHGVQSIGSFFEMNECVIFEFLHPFNGIRFELFEGFSDLFFRGVHHQISHVENSNLNNASVSTSVPNEKFFTLAMTSSST